ncbi:MAG: glycosyltransferase family 39 protein, partial [Nanoarchaeota archaeon]
EFANMILVGRVISVLFSIGTILVIYQIGKTLYNRRAGLLAALLLALNPLDVIESHYFSLDVPMTFWLMIVMLCSVHILYTGRRIWYILGGICIGIAAATKYPGLIGIVPLGIAHLLWCWKDLKESTRGLYNRLYNFLRSLLSKNLVCSLIGFVLASAIGVPYAVLEPTTFANNIITTYTISSGQSVPIPSDYNLGLASWLLHPNNKLYLYQLIAAIPFSLGIALFGLLGISIVLMIRYTQWKSTLLLLSLPLAYLIIVGRWNLVFLRYMLPIIPVLLLCCAIGYRIINKMTKHNWAPIILTFIIIYTTLFTATLDYKFNDTIDDGFLYVWQNIPEHSVIATTLWSPLRYTPLQDPAAFINGTLNNKEIIKKRQNDITHNDTIIVPLCLHGICKEYSVVTMFNPSKTWLDTYNPDYIILSSLITIGDDAPIRDPNADNERSFYKRFNQCQSGYYTIAEFDRPYLTEKFYTILDPRFKSLYASPKISILKKMNFK